MTTRTSSKDPGPFIVVSGPLSPRAEKRRILEDQLEDNTEPPTMEHSHAAVKASPAPPAVSMTKAWQNTKHRSEDLRTTIISLLDTCDDIITVGLSNADNPNLIYDSARRQVTKEVNILQKYLDIMQIFQQQVHTEPENGERREDNAYIFESLMALAVSEMHKIAVDVSHQIEDSIRAHEKLEDEHRMLNEQITKCDADLKHAQKMKNQALADKNVVKGTNLKLQEQLDEKANSILDLNRDKNVIAWQKEKQLWADGQGSKEYELEKKLKKEEDEFTISRHKLTLRINELQEQVKRLKTEKTMSLTPRMARRTMDFDHPSAEEELEGMRKQLFHSERLLILEKSEVNKQRRFYAGLMAGVKKEWGMMMVRNEIFEKDYTLEQKMFHERVTKIHESIENGKIAQVRNELPIYYKGMDIRLSNDVIEKCKSKYTARLENNADAVLGLKEVNVNPKSVSWRLGEDAPGPNLYEEMKELRSHPKLEDEKGNLKVELAVESFKNFGKERVLALHTIFNDMDKNHNHVLDTNELMESLAKPTSVNRKCTREEVSEALLEIDSDESGSLDFYEFLLLLTQLEQGKLKSTLFNTKAFSVIPDEVKELKPGSVKRGESKPASADANTKVCVVQ